MNKPLLKIALLFLALLSAAGVGYWFAMRDMDHSQMMADKPAPGDAEQKPLYWYDPMVPAQHFDQPGKSPFMDMQLVPKFANEGGDANIVQIDPRMVQNLGIRTAIAQRETLWQRVEAAGAVSADERGYQTIESRVAGWVERLNVRAVGDAVKRGQLVAEIYAPELLAAQEEFVLVLKAGDAQLTNASRQRLALLGVSEAQIRQVEKTRKPSRRVQVYAPFDGYVMELGTREGQQISPGMPLFKLADLSQVWITAEIPEAQAGWVAQGRPVEARLSAFPGEVFEGELDYLYPELNMQSRTLRARAVLKNPGFKLKPGMYAELSLFGGPREDVLMVPSAAVIRTGTRSVVMLALDDGRFKPVVVKTGGERDGRTEIFSGLEEGAQVVVSGQFLIDSEANLTGALDRLEGAEEH